MFQRRPRLGKLGWLLWLAVGLPVVQGATEAASGDLRVEVIASYNLVVDSNGQRAPSAAYLGARCYNDGTTDMTDMFACSGRPLAVRSPAGISVPCLALPGGR